MSVFTGQFVTINTILLTIFLSAFYIFLAQIKKYKNKKVVTNKQNIKDISLGFILCASNIFMTILVLIYNCYFI